MTSSRVHGRYQHEVEVAAVVRAEIELEFPSLCLPDPDPAGECVCVCVCVCVYQSLLSLCIPLHSDPFSEYHVPDTTVMAKAGFLFIRKYVRSLIVKH